MLDEAKLSTVNEKSTENLSIKYAITAPSRASSKSHGNLSCQLLKRSHALRKIINLS